MNRVHDSFSASSERVLLIWMAERLPAWVTSDQLTAIGVFGAVLSFIGFWQSGQGSLFLWLAVLGLVLNWFGDSLDGTLARQRKAERPKYGFFLDHMTDTFAMGLIAIGIGLSPYVGLALGMAALLSYYILVIQSLITSHVTAVFKISFNGLGPTEIRLFIIACTLAAIAFPTPAFVLLGVEVTLYDVILLVITVLMLVMSITDSLRTLRALAIEDPPRR
jgi:archaetidylinositol phosphate synthase